jgi:hypothetical protein
MKKLNIYYNKDNNKIDISNTNEPCIYKITCSNAQNIIKTLNDYITNVTQPLTERLSILNNLIHVNIQYYIDNMNVDELFTTDRYNTYINNKNIDISIYENAVKNRFMYTDFRFYNDIYADIKLEYNVFNTLMNNDIKTNFNLLLLCLYIFINKLMNRKNEIITGTFILLIQKLNLKLKDLDAIKGMLTVIQPEYKLISDDIRQTNKDLQIHGYDIMDDLDIYLAKLDLYLDKKNYTDTDQNQYISNDNYLDTGLYDTYRLMFDSKLKDIDKNNNNNIQYNINYYNTIINLHTVSENNLFNIFLFKLDMLFHNNQLFTDCTVIRKTKSVSTLIMELHSLFKVLINCIKYINILNNKKDNKKAIEQANTLNSDSIIYIDLYNTQHNIECDKDSTISLLCAIKKWCMSKKTISINANDILDMKEYIIDLINEITASIKINKNMFDTIYNERKIKLKLLDSKLLYCVSCTTHNIIVDKNKMLFGIVPFYNIFLLMPNLQIDNNYSPVIEPYKQLILFYKKLYLKDDNATKIKYINTYSIKDYKTHNKEDSNELMTIIKLISNYWASKLMNEDEVEVKNEIIMIKIYLLEIEIQELELNLQKSPSLLTRLIPVNTEKITQYIQILKNQSLELNNKLSINIINDKKKYNSIIMKIAENKKKYEMIKDYINICDKIEEFIKIKTKEEEKKNEEAIKKILVKEYHKLNKIITNLEKKLSSQILAQKEVVKTELETKLETELETELDYYESFMDIFIPYMKNIINVDEKKTDFKKKRTLDDGKKKGTLDDEKKQKLANEKNYLSRMLTKQEALIIKLEEEINQLKKIAIYHSFENLCIIEQKEDCNITIQQKQDEQKSQQNTEPSTIFPETNEQKTRARSGYNVTKNPVHNINFGYKYDEIHDIVVNSKPVEYIPCDNYITCREAYKIIKVLNNIKTEIDKIKNKYSNIDDIKTIISAYNDDNNKYIDNVSNFVVNLENNNSATQPVKTFDIFLAKDNIKFPGKNNHFLILHNSYNYIKKYIDLLSIINKHSELHIQDGDLNATVNYSIFTDDFKVSSNMIYTKILNTIRSDTKIPQLDKQELITIIQPYDTLFLDTRKNVLGKPINQTLSNIIQNYRKKISNHLRALREFLKIRLIKIMSILVDIFQNYTKEKKDILENDYNCQEDNINIFRHTVSKDTKLSQDTNLQIITINIETRTYICKNDAEGKLDNLCIQYEESLDNKKLCDHYSAYDGSYSYEDHKAIYELPTDIQSTTEIRRRSSDKRRRSSSDIRPRSSSDKRPRSTSVTEKPINLLDLQSQPLKHTASQDRLQQGKLQKSSSSQDTSPQGTIQKSSSQDIKKKAGEDKKTDKPSPYLPNGFFYNIEKNSIDIKSKEGIKPDATVFYTYCDQANLIIKEFDSVKEKFKSVYESNIFKNIIEIYKTKNINDLFKNIEPDNESVIDKFLLKDEYIEKFYDTVNFTYASNKDVRVISFLDILHGIYSDKKLFLKESFFKDFIVKYSLLYEFFIFMMKTILFINKIGMQTLHETDIKVFAKIFKNYTDKYNQIIQNSFDTIPIITQNKQMVTITTPEIEKKYKIIMIKKYISVILEEILKIITELFIIKAPYKLIKVRKTLTIDNKNDLAQEIYITTINIINNTFTAQNMSNPPTQYDGTFDQLFLLQNKIIVLGDPCKELFKTISPPPKK